MEGFLGGKSVFSKIFSPERSQKCLTRDQILPGEGKVGETGEKNIFSCYMELFDVFVILSLHPRAVQIPEILLPNITVGSVWAVLRVASSLAVGEVTEISPALCVVFPDLICSDHTPGPPTEFEMQGQ